VISIRAALFALALAAGIGHLPARALTVVVANNAPQIALRIGAPGNTVSTVSFNVAAATAGTGAAVLGTTNAAAGSAQAPNFLAACPANNVRVWARARSTAGLPRTATLSVNSTGGVVSGANVIPFTDFGWIASGGTELPSGSFSGSTAQPLLSFPTSNEVSVCLQFQFANTTIYPAGTYTGQLTYSLQMP
jgi:hypothetical protein